MQVPHFLPCSTGKLSDDDKRKMFLVLDSRSNKGASINLLECPIKTWSLCDWSPFCCNETMRQRGKSPSDGVLAVEQNVCDPGPGDGGKSRGGDSGLSV